jgi:hypothetical protein
LHSRQVSRELQDALARLERALSELGAPIAAAFRPGASEQAVRDALAADGLSAHEDVLAWWGWHDGAEAAAPAVERGPGLFLRGENMLVGPWHMPTLADALRTRRWNLGLDWGTDDLLPGSWLPVAMTDGAGELCADTAVSAQAPLYVLDHETLWERSPPQFESLAEFAMLLARVLEEGLVVPDAMDARARMVDFPRLPAELRRLATW